MKNFEKRDDRRSREKDTLINEHMNVLPFYAENEIHIFPNPTSNRIFIEYPQFSGAEKLFFFDITGKILLENALSGVTSDIDISTFVPGVYFIKVITHNAIFVRKIIKM